MGNYHYILDKLTFKRLCLDATESGVIGDGELSPIHPSPRHVAITFTTELSSQNIGGFEDSMRFLAHINNT
jgi:hypothetical protein